jgi:hypothetical protein
MKQAGDQGEIFQGKTLFSMIKPDFRIFNCIVFHVKKYLDKLWKFYFYETLIILLKYL